MSQTIVELFEEQVQQSSVRTALRRYRDGRWEETSWKEWWEGAERFAAGLIESGLDFEDEVCLLASTRPEWVVADMALAMSGAVSIPIHPATSADELADILEENAIGSFIVENPVQLGKILEACEDLNRLDRIIYLDHDVWVTPRGRRGGELMRIESLSVPQAIDLLSYDECRARGRAALAREPRFVARRRRQIEGTTVATVLYTAGVSHRARGVVLTHDNLAAQVQALSALRLFSSEDVQLLSLPLAHIFARVLYLAALAYGMTTVFGRGPDRLVEDLRDVGPTLMASVPRVYERLQAEIEVRIENRGWRSRFLPVALEVGKAVSKRTQGGDRVGVILSCEHRLFSRLLLEDVRELLGGNIKFLISGGAPLATETAEFFFAAGVLLLQGYGLTEASGVVACNMPDEFQLGSVGKPLPGVDVTIAEDGEVLVRGATVMEGYRSGGEEAPGIDEEGWFHTGDIGYFDRQGFLYLTDRKRDLIVTSTGAHVVGTSLEAELADHRLIAHALVIGEGRPYLVALLALEPDGILQFAEGRDLDEKLSVRELTSHSELRRELTRHIEDFNRRHSNYERIRDFAIIPEFLSIRRRTLSASGQVRRVEVLRRFSPEVERLYGESSRSRHVADRR